MRARLAVAVVAAASVCLLISSQPAAQSGGAGDVTFAKNIAPILQRSCQECHHADGVAPMSLVTYEEVRPWVRAITWSAMSMPAETPEEVTNFPSSTQRATLTQVTRGP